MYIQRNSEQPALLLSNDPIFHRHKNEEVETAIDIIGKRENVHTVVIADRK